MAKQIVSDELWAEVEPLLPEPPPRLKGGRPPIPDRKVLTGILFVLMTGMPWELLPPEMGCGSGMTCWRRLRDWQKAGVWDRLHKVLLDRLGQADRIDWTRASVDAATVASPGGPKNREESDGSRQTGNEAPSCGRPARDPARDPFDGSQRQRDDDAGGDARRDRADQTPERPPAQTPCQGAGGQRLRVEEEQGSASLAWDHGEDRAKRRGVEGEARPASLGGRANTLVVEPISAAENKI